MARKRTSFARAIKPAVYNVGTVRLEILNALRKEGTKQKNKLRQTTATWEGEKPQFVSEIHLRGGDAILEVGPKDDGSLGSKKWDWLNRGVPPHPIMAKKAPRLAFRYGGFRPKTRVRSLESVAGAAATGPLRRPFAVSHPGIQPRNWTAILYKQEKVPFRRAMDTAVKTGMKKARRQRR